MYERVSVVLIELHVFQMSAHIAPRRLLVEWINQTNKMEETDLPHFSLRQEMRVESYCLSLPFNHPLIAGSRLRYRLWNSTSPSFNSDALGASFVFSTKVSPGTMLAFGLCARWIEVYVDEDMFDVCWTAIL